MLGLGGPPWGPSETWGPLSCSFAGGPPIVRKEKNLRCLPAVLLLIVVLLMLVVLLLLLLLLLLHLEQEQQLQQLQQHLT